jgi:hypothetical protein
MGKRNRANQTEFMRRQGLKLLRSSYMIYCEGEVEEGYFSRFRKRAKSLGGGNALRVVNEAIKSKNIHHKGLDKYWVVFDKDETTNDDFNEAIRLAKENGINVAYSNQSFELWLLLHFEKVHGKLHRKNYEKRLKAYVPWYDSSKKSAEQGAKLFNTLYKHRMAAIENAKAVYNQAGDHSDPANEESSTTVFRLVELLIRET